MVVDVALDLTAVVQDRAEAVWMRPISPLCSVSAPYMHTPILNWTTPQTADGRSALLIKG